MISLQTISARGQIIERALVWCRELESASGSKQTFAALRMNDGFQLKQPETDHSVDDHGADKAALG